MRWRSRHKIARAGRVIAGRYRLEAPLGRGAMGEIWRAEHVRLKSQVAIKFLDASIADEPEMLDRFLREAQSAAAVRSTHVVQIFDCGVERGCPYISMELLEGESLDERLSAQGRLTPSELNKIFGEVALAIGNAHNIGVVHRDLKPGNIFIAREGDLEITKVLDFGIAKVMSQTLRLTTGTGTRTGTLLGTPNYMSPEQARGSRDLDQSTDLWSLAIIAFECLTGQPPFAGESLGDIVVQICTEAPIVPSSLVDVPAGFDEWFLRGVSKTRSERFTSAGEMAEALRAILAGDAAPASSAHSSREAGAYSRTLHSGAAPLEQRAPAAASLAVSSTAVLADVSSTAVLADVSSTAVSRAELASPDAALRRTDALGALFRWGVERLPSLRLWALARWHAHRPWWSAVRREFALLCEVAQRGFAPLAVGGRGLERLAIPLSLALFCGTAVMALGRGISSRTPSATPTESIATAALRPKAALVPQPAPSTPTAPIGGVNGSVAPEVVPSDVVVPDVVAPDVVASDVAVADSVPAAIREQPVQAAVSSARASAAKARRVERPAARSTRSAVPAAAPATSPPIREDVLDPFAERL